MKTLKCIAQILAALIYMGVICILVMSCTVGKKDKTDKYVIGKYLYLSDNSVLHTNKDCIELITARDDNGHRVSGMQFIDTLSFLPNDEFSYCKRCFDDECYQHAQEIMERNLEYLQREESDSIDYDF